jgi:hypothetical protein
MCIPSGNLEEMKDRLSAMGNAELLRVGQTAKYMVTPEANAGLDRDAYLVWLREARAEWNRRHAGTVIENSF